MGCEGGAGEQGCSRQLAGGRRGRTDSKSEEMLTGAELSGLSSRVVCVFYTT